MKRRPLSRGFGALAILAVGVWCGCSSSGGAPTTDTSNDGAVPASSGHSSGGSGAPSGSSGAGPGPTSG
ncbi:MAG: hypothetical protein M3O36_11260, partial [Myxococcota bacterium]|nr:hypothetical protein [Myxococcota bacterium]